MNNLINKEEEGWEPKQTQPKYDAGSGNRTRATLVGGELSHHCAEKISGPGTVQIVQ